MNINDLKPLEKNPFKKKGDKQIERISKSINDFKEMMEIRKIVIDENNVILGGNKRYFALKMLGYKDIPDKWIYKAEGLSEKQKREFSIKDNAHWGSEWDFDLLREWEIDLEDFGVLEEDTKKGISKEKGEVEFSEVLEEYNNYIILKFNNELDWLQAKTLFDIKDVKCLSSRKDGKVSDSYTRIGIGRVLDGSKAINRIVKD